MNIVDEDDGKTLQIFKALDAISFRHPQALRIKRGLMRTHKKLSCKFYAIELLAFPGIRNIPSRNKI